jgi:hypothetical protein
MNACVYSSAPEPAVQITRTNVRPFNAPPSRDFALAVVAVVVAVGDDGGGGGLRSNKATTYVTCSMANTSFIKDMSAVKLVFCQVTLRLVMKRNV